MQNKGQVTIFIILVILIVAGVALFLIFREPSSITKVPSSMKPLYTSFLSCLEEDTLTGADILMNSGGYIEMPEFEPGSPYMPFSSQLNFLGNPIPYWYYVSGNNLEKQQIPSKKEMENELGNFIENRILSCSFESYYDSGYEVLLGEPNADVIINDKDIDVTLNMDLTINRGENSVRVREHFLSANSNLGKLYDSAIKVYKEEQKELFLEEYTIDVLRLYAPVDGVEISCSPLIWNAQEVFEELSEAIEINILSLKSKGASDDYFVVDLPINENVRFLTSSNWPSNFEVNPSEGMFLISKPVGTQSGLGILGFCYVNYHYVYDVKYPVLIQVYENDEIFQFPVAVIIRGNNPREPLSGEAVAPEDSSFCEDASTLVRVHTYDSNLVPVSADISYECFGNTCDLGKTSPEGVLETEFPQCVNGYVLARAEGYSDYKTILSVVDGGEIYLILNRLYDKKVNLRLDGSNYNGEAIINFVSEDLSKTIIYPDTRSVELSEGDYNVSVYIYQNSSLSLSEQNYEQCVEIPSPGIGGMLGFTQEKCFEVSIPPQIISNALAGGGEVNYYITEEELRNSETIAITAESLPRPSSLEQLQKNHLLFETKDLGIFFI